MYQLTNEGTADRSQQGLWITEQAVCETCGEGFTVKLHTVKGHYSDDYFTIVRCKRCGLIFVNPRLDKAFREFCYQHEQHLVDWFLRSKSEEEYGSRKTLDVLAALRHAGGDLLDVGCGIGTFLSVARQRGFRGMGIELNEKTAAYAARHGQILQGDFYNVNLPWESFDVIYMSQTLEHLERPLAALQRAYQLLRPGGLLWITVPRTDWLVLFKSRALVQGSSPRPPFWSPEDHLYYFTPYALRRLFEQAGFRNMNNCDPRLFGWRGVARLVRELLGLSSGFFLANKPI